MIDPKKHPVYWPYNTTFHYYHPVPLAGKRGVDFVNKKNEEKGGRWVLHTPEEHQAWFDEKGSHLEFLGLRQ